MADEPVGCGTVTQVTDAWNEALELLGKRSVTCRLDPWTAELVRQLGMLGALDRPAVGVSRRSEVRAAAGAYNDWTSAHMFEPAAVLSDQALKSIIMEMRTWLSVGGDGLESARAWTGEILLERISGSSRPALIGALRRMAGGIAVGNPQAAARQAAAWWLARNGR